MGKTYIMPPQRSYSSHYTSTTSPLFLTKGVHLNQPSFTALISGPQARNTNHWDGKSSGDSHGYMFQHDPPPHTTTLPCTQPSRAQNTDCLPFAMISDGQTKTTMLRWLPPWPNSNAMTALIWRQLIETPEGTQYIQLWQ
jgi:hypothetical protein